jgi:GT2 family glycosyltransferase
MTDAGGIHAQASSTPVTDRTALPAVAIVSVTYNRCEPLLFLLSRLRELDYPPELFDIYLVDNASGDGTAARVASEFPEVHLTLSQENLGTSAGFNLGMRQALEADQSYEYIWLLDSDAEVEAATLLPMIQSMQADQSIGIIGSTVYDPDNRERVVATGLHIDWNRGNVSLVKTEPPATSDVNNVELVAACSLLIRTELCRKLGLWDERFWVYWGDTDWCQRVLQDGSRVCGHFKSRVWHRDWANTRRSFGAPTVLYDDLRGGLLFNVRHNPRRSLAGARHLLLKSYLKGAMEQLTMRNYFSSAYIEAFNDFSRGDFHKRGLGNVVGSPEINRLEDVCKQLSKVLPENPVIADNLVHDDSAVDVIRQTVTDSFPAARWHRLCTRQPQPRQDFTTDYPLFRYEIGQLLKFLGKRRYDVIISDISTPHLYTLTAARYTVLVDAAGRASLQRNRIFRGLLNMLQILLQGLKAAYIDLPRACRGNTSLQAAVEDFRCSAGMSTTVQVGEP